MNAGDKIKFKHYGLWDDANGIAQSNFERDFSYNLTYTVEWADDTGDIFMVKSPENSGFIHDEQHAIMVNNGFPEDLFNV